EVGEYRGSQPGSSSCARSLSHDRLVLPQRDPFDSFPNCDQTKSKLVSADLTVELTKKSGRFHFSRICIARGVIPLPMSVTSGSRARGTETWRNKHEYQSTLAWSACRACCCRNNECPGSGAAKAQYPLHHGRRYRLDAAEHLSPRPDGR